MLRHGLIAAANHVYSCSTSPTINRIRVDHDLFQRVCTKLRRLRKSLQEAEQEEFWRDLLRPIKRYCFDRLAAPLPLGNFDDQALRAKCNRGTAQIPHLYPDMQQVWNDLCLDYFELLDSNENPLLQSLQAALRTAKGHSAILVKESRLVGRTEQQILAANASSAPVISPLQVIDDKCYENIFAIGAARWLPAHVFSAPRSANITLVRFRWLSDRLERPATLIGQKSASGSISVTLAFDDPGTIDAEDAVPKTDWTYIGRKVHWATEGEGNYEKVEARLAILEHERAVFLDAGEGGTVTILKPREDDPREKIRRVPTDNLRPGDYLLLRTSGGGDYIVPVADRIMGNGAEPLRKLQRAWKEKLRDHVRSSGLLETSLQLLELGSSCADEGNVRNWMSFRSIKTHNDSDFKAVMTLVGLGNQWQNYWEAMCQIDSAHRRAGQLIRRLLLRRLAATNLTDLEKKGWTEFSLPDTDAGTIAALRLLEVSPHSTEIPVYRLGHLFIVGDESDG